MAVVRKREYQELEQEVRHLDVDCTHSVVAQPEGKDLQIDTYGSHQRKLTGKKSQSIRFLPEAIVQLKRILHTRFSEAELG